MDLVLEGLKKDVRKMRKYVKRLDKTLEETNNLEDEDDRQDFVYYVRKINKLTAEIDAGFTKTYGDLKPNSPEKKSIKDFSNLFDMSSILPSEDYPKKTAVIGIDDKIKAEVTQENQSLLEEIVTLKNENLKLSLQLKQFKLGHPTDSGSKIDPSLTPEPTPLENDDNKQKNEREDLPSSKEKDLIETMVELDKNDPMQLKGSSKDLEQREEGKKPNIDSQGPGEPKPERLQLRVLQLEDLNQALKDKIQSLRINIKELKTQNKIMFKQLKVQQKKNTKPKRPKRGLGGSNLMIDTEVIQEEPSDDNQLENKPEDPVDLRKQITEQQKVIDKLLRIETKYKELKVTMNEMKEEVDKSRQDKKITHMESRQIKQQMEKRELADIEKTNKIENLIQIVHNFESTVSNLAGQVERKEAEIQRLVKRHKEDLQVIKNKDTMIDSLKKEVSNIEGQGRARGLTNSTFNNDNYEFAPELLSCQVSSDEVISKKLSKARKNWTFLTVRNVNSFLATKFNAGVSMVEAGKLSFFKATDSKPK